MRNLRGVRRRTRRGAGPYGNREVVRVEVLRREDGCLSSGSDVVVPILPPTLNLNTCGVERSLHVPDTTLFSRRQWGLRSGDGKTVCLRSGTPCVGETSRDRRLGNQDGGRTEPHRRVKEVRRRDSGRRGSGWSLQRGVFGRTGETNGPVRKSRNPKGSGLVR